MDGTSTERIQSPGKLLIPSCPYAVLTLVVDVLLAIFTCYLCE